LHRATTLEHGGVVVSEAQYQYGSTGVPLDDPGVHNPIASSSSNF